MSGRISNRRQAAKVSHYPNDNKSYFISHRFSLMFITYYDSMYCQVPLVTTCVGKFESYVPLMQFEKLHYTPNFG